MARFSIRTRDNRPLGLPGKIVGAPISEGATSGKGAGCLVLFFAVFLLAGVGISIPLLVLPVTRTIQAKHWREVTCQVISSRVRSHSSDDGTTYSVDILYSYRFNGRAYRSNRYHFMGGSSSGRSGKQAVVRRYRPGTKVVCYVDPQHPEEAVLERGWSASLLFGLIPLVFVMVGAGGMLFSVREVRRRKTAPAWAASSPVGAGFAGRSDAARGTAGAAGPLMLKASASPWGKLVGTVLVALFWNGIVSVFVFQAIESWRRHRPEWFLMVFLIPFVLIGLGLIGGVFYFFLALFNPRPTLQLSASALFPGDSCEVNWSLTGRVQRIKRLRLLLEGREEAMYQRGTRSYTDKHPFATVELATLESGDDMRSGVAKLQIPPGTMHSFASDHNKIVWVLRLEADVEGMPDLKDEFPVAILPHPVKEGNRWAEA